MLVVHYCDSDKTNRLAEEIGETAAGAGKARLVSIDQLTTSDLWESDLVVIGSPTHYQNLLKLFCEALAGRPVAAFDISAETWELLMRLTAAHRLRRSLGKLCGKPVAKAETFLVK